MNFSPFFLPHFPGAPRSEGPLLPRRAGALWEGPVPFGRNRESRTREAAGRRNWPEAVPRKMSGRKRLYPRLSERPNEDQTHESDHSRENVESTSALFRTRQTLGGSQSIEFCRGV